MITGIVVALPEEIESLTKQKIARGSCVFLSPTLLICHAGTGPANAHAAVQQLVKKHVTHIISWGCAAALDPDLIAGNLSIPGQVISEGKDSISLHSVWHSHVSNILAGQYSLTATSLVESKRIISLSSEKQAIHASTKAHVLDMESYAVAESAQAANLPCLVIRAVADPVSMDLPEAVVYAMHENGSIEIKKLLGYIVFHPLQIPALISLGMHFRAATQTLKKLARQLDTLIDYQNINT